MMVEPLISVVINSYNQSRYLEDCILSVITQEYPNLEVILVDGGSTDGSLEIIRKYSDQFAWWISEKDEGQANGINKGLAHAQGEWLAWLNSDDLYKPGVIRRVAEIARDYPHTVILHGEVEAIDADGRLINRMKTGPYSRRDLMTFHILNQPAVFFRGEAYRKSGGLDLSYQYLLDHHFWLRLTKLGNLQYFHEYWASARFHNEAKNLAQANHFGEEAYRISEWLLIETPSELLDTTLIREIQAGASRIDARYQLDAGQPGEALRAYWHGMIDSPKIILPEWHRIIYCLLSLIGLGKIKNLYHAVRRWVYGIPR